MVKDRIRKISLVCFFFVGIFSCREDQKKNKISSEKESKSKPPSSFTDTLKINSRSAVFYYPDSIQLEKIKAITEKSIFDGSMHEYFYQVKSVHDALKKYWPTIKIVEAKNVRYLQFVKKDQTNEFIDLDTKNDAQGLFVFDPAKSPIQLELTNAESEIGFYFSTNKPVKNK
jgi:hypothetical protein